MGPEIEKHEVGEGSIKVNAAKEQSVCSNGLLSCPFCAGKADETKGDRGIYTVTCWKCEFDGPDFNTREAANAVWNSRAG